MVSDDGESHRTLLREYAKELQQAETCPQVGWTVRR